MALKFIIRKGKDKINKKGQSLILCRYTEHDNSEAKNYSSVYFSTKYKIEPKYWNDATGKAKGGTKASAINDNLNQFETTFLELIREVKNQNRYPTTDNIKRAYEGKLNDSKTESGITKSIFNQWNTYIERKSKTLTKQTATGYRNAMNTMITFLSSIGKSNIQPSGLTYAMIQDYETYLSSKYKPNTISKYKKRLKEFLKDYTYRGGDLNFNLTRIKYKEIPKPKTYLTDLELQSIKDLVLNGTQIINRDVFLLQCYTGLRISDIKNLDKNIEKDTIKLTTQKNNRDVTIPISKEAKSILEKYEYKLPYISEPVLNRDIKKICKKAIPDSTVQIRDENKKLHPVPKHELISSHDAIRTFVLLCIERGMTLYSIAQITGKSMGVLQKHYIPESNTISSKEFMKAWDIAPMKIA